MGIVITNQTNEQECGVCVLTSLHNYYYKSSTVQKQNVLDNSKFTNTGMSIFDFEVCANQLGLECESYEVKWSEFLDLKLNSYFVLLLKTNGESNHYVIAKKHKLYIEIYDSCSSKPTKFKYSEIKEKFLNVLILINKKPSKVFSSVFSKAKTLLMFDLKFVILNILLSVLILVISVLAASYLNWVIDLSISKTSIRNLLTVSFIFILIYISNNILNYITSIYSSSHLKSYLLLFTNKILSSLQFKKLSFFNKIDRNWIYKVDECVYNISNFCVVEVNKLITNSIFSVVCICIIGIKQVYLLIFCIVIPLVQSIFFFISYRKKKSMFLNIVRTENKNSDLYKNLIYSVGNENWFEKKSNLINQIKLNYSSIYKNFNDATLFRGNVELFKSICKTIIEIALITTMSLLIIRNKDLSIGSLTFIIAAFGLYTNSTNQIFTYFLTKIEFEIYWQVYKDITEVDNLNQTQLINIEQEIKSISFKYDSKNIQLNSNIDNILSIPIIELIKECSSLYFNNQKVDKTNTSILNNLIICDENTSFDFSYFLKLFEIRPELYAPYIRYFQIDLNNPNQSFHKRTLLNLMCLIHESKKTIILDSILDVFPSKDKLMLKDIVNKIQKQNYVFIVRKEQND